MYSGLCVLQVCGMAFLMCSVRTQEVTTNNPVATTQLSTSTNTLSRYEGTREGRGMMSMDYMPDHDVSDHDHDHMPEQKAVKGDPWEGYYDFLINEGSFKFWAVFQLVTALVLTYAAFAAVYYAKFNVIAPDYDYYDGFFGRSESGVPPSDNQWLGLSSQTWQRIFDALSSKKYS